MITRVIAFVVLMGKVYINDDEYNAIHYINITMVYRFLIIILLFQFHVNTSNDILNN